MKERKHIKMTLITFMSILWSEIDHNIENAIQKKKFSLFMEWKSHSNVLFVIKLILPIHEKRNHVKTKLITLMFIWWFEIDHNIENTIEKKRFSLFMERKSHLNVLFVVWKLIFPIHEGKKPFKKWNWSH